MERDITIEKVTRRSLNPVHSGLLFKVKHLMISAVTGYFSIFNVTATSEGCDFLKPLSIGLIADEIEIHAGIQLTRPVLS